MNKKGGVLILVLTVILSVGFIHFVSEDVFLSTQPNEAYNLGDTLSVDLSSDGTEGWTSVDIICSNQSRMLYFHYLTDQNFIYIYHHFKDFH